MALVELPPWHLQAHAKLGFEFCDETHSRAWSLGPCKSPRNMQPGHVSLRLGLLDGKLFRLIFRGSPDLQVQVSSFTTDVELSLRCFVWTVPPTEFWA